MELVKRTRVVGNSAGVLLPRSWAGAMVRVTLVGKPKLGDILGLIDVDKASGIFLSGSYARGEQGENSDVDILVITENYDGVEIKGRYEINYLSRNNLEGMNFLIYYPMIVEAKALMNEVLLENLKKNLKLSKKLILKFKKDTKKMLELNEMEIRLAELKRDEFVGYDVGYSLILRFRTLYILDCLSRKRVWSSREFVKVVKDISGSGDAYETYKNVKKGENISLLKVGEARKLVEYLKKKNEELKCLKEIKD